MSDKLPVDARHLSLKDLKRAKAGPLEGRDPYALLPDTLERQTLIAWCMRSRDDPEFTWADAETATTLGDFEWGAQEGDDDEPPLTDSSGEPGEPAATPKPKRSRAKPPEPEPSTSSDPSSASPATSSST